ncbi:MAG: UPF0758 protein YsxA [Patescibacteria group bacterium]|nr:MAG: UPF0758 protein YsxA [Patescibacteria group bacterium]
MKIKNLPKFQRPREKLLEKGADNLKDYEILAIILRTGTKGKSAIEIAKSILKKYNLKQLTKVEVSEIANIAGVGLTKAIQIKSALELGKRVFKQPKKDEVYINSAEDAYKVLKQFANQKKEHLIGLYLNAKNKLIKTEIISIGILNQSLAHPREVFQPAIKHLCCSVIIGHNHPSEDPTPSEDDIAVTEKLKSAGKILGIDLLDHIIFTKKRFFSFKAQNLI